MSFFPHALSRALDVSSLRHRTIASNIANVDTPGYKSKEVQFDAVLQEALNRSDGLRAYRTDERHVPFRAQRGAPVRPMIVSNPYTTVQHNGNNVDMDYEMNQLAKNQIYYHALIDRVNGHFNKLQTVISEGR